jgi:hypothetical protein
MLQVHRRFEIPIMFKVQVVVHLLIHDYIICDAVGLGNGEIM